MSTWDRASYYYSGQGVVLVGERDTLGKAKALKALGNCTDLKISIDTSVVEHKESQSGQRATDFRLTTETKCSLSVTLENFVRDALALMFRGDYADVAGAAIVGEALKLYNGVIAFAKIKASAVTLKRGATTLTAYTNDATPYDYKLNGDAGSIQINDGSVVAIDKLTTGGTVPSAVTVGALTRVTVANTAAVGEYAWFSGFTGADAALVNGKAHKIAAATGTYVDLDLNTTGKTITVGTPLSAFEGIALTADYTHAAQALVNALTTGSQERFLRFEGLNTLDNNAPVIVEVFKFVVDPAAEFPLIGDENAASFVLEGNVLSDALQSSGSKFFRQQLVR